MARPTRIIVRLARWALVSDDPALVSVAEEVAFARALALATSGSRARPLRSAWTTAEDDIATLDDPARTRRSRLAAGERARVALGAIRERAGRRTP